MFLTVQRSEMKTDGDAAARRTALRSLQLISLELLAVALFNLVLLVPKVGLVPRPADATVALAPGMPPPGSTGRSYAVHVPVFTVQRSSRTMECQSLRFGYPTYFSIMLTAGFAAPGSTRMPTASDGETK